MAQPPTSPTRPALPRFYHPGLPTSAEGEPTCALNLEQSRHARKVLRLRSGDGLELFDGRGGLASAVVADSESGGGGSSGGVVCRVVAVEHHEPTHPPITVAAAVPKGARADEMIDQLSQLGADRFVPLRTRRSVVDPRPGKLERFARHAVESAKQCGRLHVMTVDAPGDLAAVLAEARDGPADLRLLAAPEGLVVAGLDLGQRLVEARQVLVLVGPEGGWTEAEIAAATQAGFELWAIAPNILRIETAAPAALAVLRYLAMGAGREERQ